MIKFVFINLAVLLGLLLGIESCSWSILSAKGQAQPFFIDPTAGFGKTLQAPDQFQKLRHLDPLLGWGYDPESVLAKKTLKNEYVIMGSEHPKALRLVMTGGSTTDSFVRDETWPRLLTEKLLSAGYCVRSYVGAVSGYNSNQEMLKIVRDHASLNPDIHISYSGVNEHEKEKYTLSSFYLMNLMGRMISYRRLYFMPNSVWLLGDFLNISQGQIKGMNEGLDQPHDVADRWTSNQRRMHALAQEFGYTFIGVLQPILGIGKYVPSDEERKRIQEMQLVTEWQGFYTGARKSAQQYKFLQDFVDIFEGKTGFFADDCHVNGVGEYLIADKMFEMLTKLHAEKLRGARVLDCAPSAL